VASIHEFERQVFDVEAVRLVVRASGNVEIPDYPYVRKASDSTTVSEFTTNRIMPLLSHAGMTFTLVSGDGNANIHGLTLMGTLRKSYSR
jgi:hypothetical protein